MSYSGTSEEFSSGVICRGRERWQQHQK